MKLFLNNILKGLLVSLLVITLGGFLYLNISKPEEINLKLVSSSVVNQIGTKSPIKKESKEETENNESKVLVEEKKEEDKKVEIKEETPKVEEKKEETPQNNQTQNNSQASTPKGGYAPNLAVANMKAKTTYKNKNITAYGPDCVGCGGMVAHGEYVGGGNIYYQDKTFGSVRIVAGDRSLGFGTIVRISGLSAFGGSILAIMLDTGGAIGFNKNIYFDLLYESESAASNFGSPNATFEILRYGF